MGFLVLFMLSRTMINKSSSLRNHKLYRQVPALPKDALTLPPLHAEHHANHDKHNNTRSNPATSAIERSSRTSALKTAKGTTPSRSSSSGTVFNDSSDNNKHSSTNVANVPKGKHPCESEQSVRHRQYVADHSFADVYQVDFAREWSAATAALVEEDSSSINSDNNVEYGRLCHGDDTNTPRKRPRADLPQPQVQQRRRDLAESVSISFYDEDRLHRATAIAHGYWQNIVGLNEYGDYHAVRDEEATTVDAPRHMVGTRREEGWKEIRAALRQSIDRSAAQEVQSRARKRLKRQNARIPSESKDQPRKMDSQQLPAVGSGREEHGSSVTHISDHEDADAVDLPWGAVQQPVAPDVIEAAKGVQYKWMSLLASPEGAMLLHVLPPTIPRFTMPVHHFFHALRGHRSHNDDEGNDMRDHGSISLDVTDGQVALRRRRVPLVKATWLIKITKIQDPGGPALSALSAVPSVDASTATVHETRESTSVAVKSSWIRSVEWTKTFIAEVGTISSCIVDELVRRCGFDSENTSCTSASGSETRSTATYSMSDWRYTLELLWLHFVQGLLVRSMWVEHIINLAERTEQDLLAIGSDPSVKSKGSGSLCHFARVNIQLSLHSSMFSRYVPYVCKSVSHVSQLFRSVCGITTFLQEFTACIPPSSPLLVSSFQGVQSATMILLRDMKASILHFAPHVQHMSEYAYAASNALSARKNSDLCDGLVGDRYLCDRSTRAEAEGVKTAHMMDAVNELCMLFDVCAESVWKSATKCGLDHCRCCQCEDLSKRSQDRAALDPLPYVYRLVAAVSRHAALCGDVFAAVQALVRCAVVVRDCDGHCGTIAQSCVLVPVVLGTLLRFNCSSDGCISRCDRFCSHLDCIWCFSVSRSLEVFLLQPWQYLGIDRMEYDPVVSLRSWFLCRMLVQERLLIVSRALRKFLVLSSSLAPHNHTKSVVVNDEASQESLYIACRAALCQPVCCRFVQCSAEERVAGLQRPRSGCTACLDERNLVSQLLCDGALQFARVRSQKESAWEREWHLYHSSAVRRVLFSQEEPSVSNTTRVSGGKVPKAAPPGSVPLVPLHPFLIDGPVYSSAERDRICPVSSCRIVRDLAREFVTYASLNVGRVSCHDARSGSIRATDEVEMISWRLLRGFGYISEYMSSIGDIDGLGWLIVEMLGFAPLLDSTGGWATELVPYWWKDCPCTTCDRGCIFIAPIQGRCVVDLILLGIFPAVLRIIAMHWTALVWRGFAHDISSVLNHCACSIWPGLGNASLANVRSLQQWSALRLPDALIDAHCCKWITASAGKRHHSSTQPSPFSGRASMVAPPEAAARYHDRRPYVAHTCDRTNVVSSAGHGHNLFGASHVSPRISKSTSSRDIPTAKVSNAAEGHSGSHGRSQLTSSMNRSGFYVGRLKRRSPLRLVTFVRLLEEYVAGIGRRSDGPWVPVGDRDNDDEFWGSWCRKEARAAQNGSIITSLELYRLTRGADNRVDSMAVSLIRFACDADDGLAHLPVQVALFVARLRIESLAFIAHRLLSLAFDDGVVGATKRWRDQLLEHTIKSLECLGNASDLRSEEHADDKLACLLAFVGCLAEMNLVSLEMFFAEKHDHQRNACRMHAASYVAAYLMCCNGSEALERPRSFCELDVDSVRESDGGIVDEPAPLVSTLSYAQRLGGHARMWSLHRVLVCSDVAAFQWHEKTVLALVNAALVSYDSEMGARKRPLSECRTYENARYVSCGIVSSFLFHQLLRYHGASVSKKLRQCSNSSVQLFLQSLLGAAHDTDSVGHASLHHTKASPGGVALRMEGSAADIVDIAIAGVLCGRSMNGQRKQRKLVASAVYLIVADVEDSCRSVTEQLVDHAIGGVASSQATQCSIAMGIFRFFVLFGAAKDLFGTVIRNLLGQVSAPVPLYFIQRRGPWAFVRISSLFEIENVCAVEQAVDTVRFALNSLNSGDGEGVQARALRCFLLLRVTCMWLVGIMTRIRCEKVAYHACSAAKCSSSGSNGDIQLILQLIRAVSSFFRVLIDCAVSRRVLSCHLVRDSGNVQTQPPRDPCSVILTPMLSEIVFMFSQISNCIQPVYKVLVLFGSGPMARKAVDVLDVHHYLAWTAVCVRHPHHDVAPCRRCAAAYLGCLRGSKSRHVEDECDEDGFVATISSAALLIMADVLPTATSTYQLLPPNGDLMVSGAHVRHADAASFSGAASLTFPQSRAHMLSLFDHVVCRAGEEQSARIAVDEGRSEVHTSRLSSLLRTTSASSASSRRAVAGMVGGGVGGNGLSSGIGALVARFKARERYSAVGGVWNRIEGAVGTPAVKRRLLGTKGEKAKCCNVSNVCI